MTRRFGMESTLESKINIRGRCLFGRTGTKIKEHLGMSRKLPILALFVIGLQVFEILTLGTSPVGSLTANSLQLFACAIGAAMAFGASRRGRGLTRPFWRLIALGLATWGVANL